MFCWDRKVFSWQLKKRYHLLDKELCKLFYRSLKSLECVVVDFLILVLVSVQIKLDLHLIWFGAWQKPKIFSEYQKTLWKNKLNIMNCTWRRAFESLIVWRNQFVLLYFRNKRNVRLKSCDWRYVKVVTTFIHLLQTRTLIVNSKTQTLFHEDR